MRAPQLPLDQVDEIIAANNVPRDLYPVVALAFRGYWLDSMGKPGANDRGIYDDAHIIRWPDGVARFVGNTDPNGYRKGRGTGRGKGMAMLKAGIHIYGTGLHKGRLGFRQCEPFTVTRDGDPPYDDTGMHAINWHDGGGTQDSIGRTWSEGCQTNPHPEWKILRPMLYGLLDRYGNAMARNDRGQLVRSAPYILIEETERRAGNIIASRRWLG